LGWCLPDRAARLTVAPPSADDGLGVARPEDLRGIDPATVGVAFLSRR